MSVSVEWFLRELQGDKLIARLAYSGPVQRTTAMGRFYTYFNHPAGPVAAEFRYFESAHDNLDLPPLDMYPFPPLREEWDEHIEKILNDWYAPWQLEQTTVFTQQVDELTVRHSAWPPNVVHSLAMAEGMARAIRIRPYEPELADILVRRLHGLVSIQMNEMLESPMVRELIEGATKEKRKLQEGQKAPDPTTNEEGDDPDKQ